MTRETILHYELRDGVDDLPYATTYASWQQAHAAAARKGAKLGHPVQVWAITPNGERFEGEF